MNAATSGLIDIIEPAQPVASTVHDPVMGLAAAAALLLLVILAVWRQRQRCRRTTRKYLQQLRLRLQTGDVNQQDAAYALAAELARIFKLRRLQAHNPPAALPQTAHADWANLVSSLDKLRYQTDIGIDAQAWARLFSIAESASRWSGRC
ncbi:MAG: hypothetical protein P4L77_09440 [Sulfuriferula sp.]|nr:hypothetical protein [Sulfuriferula sp.]